jgi:dTDP-4-amino-4,6-dideoxygalactose transaminase
MKYLASQNIQTLIHYPVPLHLQSALGYLNYKKGDLPVSEKIASELVSLPMYPELEKNQIEYISNKLKAFYNNE